MLVVTRNNILRSKNEYNIYYNFEYTNTQALIL